MKDKKLTILDSTLRDGAQGEGISFSVRDKLAVCRALDELGVDYIEAGNPSSNPKDAEFFKETSASEAGSFQAYGVRFNQAARRFRAAGSRT